MDRLKKLIEESGFQNISLFDASELVVRQEVRDMCAADKCDRYDKSWSCPPACGSLDEYRELFRNYRKGYLFQTVTPLEDEFDFESIMEGSREHAARFDELINSVSEQLEDVLLLSAGTCTLCATCTYPDKPCIHPEKIYPSMEACGLVVSDVCKLADAKYYHGPNTSTFVSCALFNEHP